MLIRNLFPLQVSESEPGRCCGEGGGVAGAATGGGGR